MDGTFLTFDTESKRVVWEAPSELLVRAAMRGRIISISEFEIQFELLLVGLPPTTATLDRRTGTLTQTSAPASAGASASILQCEKTSLRLILESYDNIAPYDRGN
jgi:hypothetical protein